MELFEVSTWQIVSKILSNDRFLGLLICFNIFPFIWFIGSTISEVYLYFYKIWVGGKYAYISNYGEDQCQEQARKAIPCKQDSGGSPDIKEKYYVIEGHGNFSRGSDITLWTNIETNHKNGNKFHEHGQPYSTTNLWTVKQDVSGWTEGSYGRGVIPSPTST